MIYNHKLINDLAWVIGSPSLIAEADYKDSRLLTNQWFKKQLKISETFLTQHDKNPREIQAFLSQMPAFKLGIYFEQLIHFWLNIHPDYEVIHNNLILSADKLTLGEMDFVIKDATGRVIHLEVAVKFFLQINNQQQSHWLGPNLKDRLDLKVNKLLSQQIELSNKALAKTELQKLDIAIDEHWVLLKGRLFKHDKHLTADCAWLSLEDFSRYQNNDSRWVILDKSYWLSEIANINECFLPTEILSKDELLNSLNRLLEKKPVCVAKIDHNKESKRLFITANNWQQKALDSLA